MRNLLVPIERDLKQKFVFLAGPRQVGKTTLAQEIVRRGGGKYYNWDDGEDRQAILTKQFLKDGTVILDELHKYDRWKNFIKGVYDKYHETLKAIVTGSARLDVYRRGGDSLFGRYYLYHLYPLSLGELTNPSTIQRPEQVLAEAGAKSDRRLFENLIRFGGFPEPFYKGTEESHQKWSIQRSELLIRQDIRDLTQINLLTLVEHLLLLLPQRVGSLLSINSLKEDVQVAFNTVKSWLATFEHLYITFELHAYSTKIQRSIRKEKKLYLWDWSQVQDPSRRFENLVASHLLKAVQLWRDLGYGDFDLYFLRDRDRREVDFLVTRNRRPWLLVEAKLSESQPWEPLFYFQNRLGVPAVQLIQLENVNKKEGPIRVVSADRWLPMLP